MQLNVLDHFNAFFLVGIGHVACLAYNNWSGCFIIIIWCQLNLGELIVVSAN